MKNALIFFLRKLTDPYLLSQLLEIKNESDEIILDEIKESYGIGKNINSIFKHFKNIPLNTNINIIGLEGIDEELDITPTFLIKQQIIIVGCDGDSYLINLPIKI